MFADLFPTKRGPAVGARRCDSDGDGAAGVGGLVGSGCSLSASDEHRVEGRDGVGVDR